MTGALSRFTLNGNQETTKNSTYKNKVVSKINEIKEIPEGDFTNNLKLTKNINLEGTYTNG